MHSSTKGASGGAAVRQRLRARAQVSCVPLSTALGPVPRRHVLLGAPQRGSGSATCSPTPAARQTPWSHQTAAAAALVARQQQGNQAQATAVPCPAQGRQTRVPAYAPPSRRRHSQPQQRPPLATQRAKTTAPLVGASVAAASAVAASAVAVACFAAVKAHPVETWGTPGSGGGRSHRARSAGQRGGQPGPAGTPPTASTARADPASDSRTQSHGAPCGRGWKGSAQRSFHQSQGPTAQSGLCVSLGQTPWPQSRRARLPRRSSSVQGSPALRLRTRTASRCRMRTRRPSTPQAACAARQLWV